MKTDRLLRQGAVHLKSGYRPAAYPQRWAENLSGVNLSMKNIIKIGFAVIIFSSTLFASPPNAPALPAIENVLTVDFNFVPKERKPYFSNKSFMELYPKLIPAEVQIPSGAKRFFQSGVIVTTDKKVLFWNTCADNFINVVTESGETISYATSKSLEVK